MSELPQDHPQRFVLNDEVHARPPDELSHPARISYLALYCGSSNSANELDMLAELAEQAHEPLPAQGDTHYTLDLGAYRLRWERHTEFARYMIVASAEGEQPFESAAMTLLPAGWVGRLPGELMVATHVALVGAEYANQSYDDLSDLYFHGNPLVGSRLADGAGMALTDLRINADGFSRLLVIDQDMSARQTGRMVQRLLEIDTYRVMALLAFPVARDLGPYLLRAETALAEITNTLLRDDAADDAELLNELIRLQASLEYQQARNNFRFGAATAYHDVVKRRIGELREQRLEGLQTFREFTERRLVPAINTCEAVARRQESLSRRTARATQLLSTRVDVGRAQQNQALLASMNRRGALQLRLQQTVEGLSVAAITYYVVTLISYVAKSFVAIGLPVYPELVAAISIPFVALIVAIGIRRVRKIVSRESEK